MVALQQLHTLINNPFIYGVIDRPMNNMNIQTNDRVQVDMIMAVSVVCQ